MRNTRTVVILLAALFILVVAILDLSFQSVALVSAANQTPGANPAGELEQVISKSFPFSDQLLQLRTLMEVYSGKKNINSVFILRDRLIAQQRTTNANAMQRNLQFIEDFSLCSANKYLMVIPSASEIYSSELPNTGESTDRRMTVKSLYDSIEGDLIKIDVVSVFYIVRDDYIYYRTDRNLTSLGGYYLYKSIGNKMGFQVLPKESFDIHFSSREFYGNLCSQASYYGVTPDIISDYSYSDAPELTSVKVIANNMEKAGGGADFLNEKLFTENTMDTNFWIAEIDTSLSSGQSLLVFTNGISKAVIPYLTMHYKHVTVVDTNCPVNLYEQIKGRDYDQVLFAVDMDQFVSANIYGHFGE